MFGPNTYFKDNVNINYSHRDKHFFDIYHEVKELFQQKFNLNDYDILFIPGSATVGVEAVMYSLNRPIELIGPEGTFKSRWQDMQSNYFKLLTEEQQKQKPFQMFCLLETSCSEPYSTEGCFVDATSGFPYYDIPKNSLGFVTSLNKQLGSYVGVCVVGIRKDMWCYFKDATYMSYLNLSRYKAYGESNQTPSTAPTNIFEHFLSVLKKFDVNELRQRVNNVCNMLVGAIGQDNFIGSINCPALTLKYKIIPEELCKKYDIYGYWANREHYQFFTYNGSYEDYQNFINDLLPYLNKNTRQKVIAIDYDGTITHYSKYPQEADIRQDAIKYIKLLYQKGYKLILWTARQEPYYSQCIDKLKKNDLYKYFCFNHNAYGFNGKVIADFYIDDKSCIEEISWEKIYNYITNHIKT